MGKSDVLEKIKLLGIKDPLNPTSGEMKIILDAYLKDKTLDHAIFKDYMATVPPTLNVLFNGLVQFSKDNKDVAVKTLDIINNAIGILGEELKRDLSSEERAEIRGQILEYIKEARKESQENRQFLARIATIGGGVALVAIGTGIFIVTKGRNPQVIEQGVKLISKVI